MLKVSAAIKPARHGICRHDRRCVAPLLGILALALAWLPAHAEPFRLIVTEISTPLLPNSVMELAKSLGYFEREGVEVEIVRVQETPLAMAALVGGEGDMANVAVDAVLRLIAREKFQAKAVTTPNKAFPYVIVGRKGIDSLAALAGATFGVGRIGSLDHSLAREVLRARGVDPDKVGMLGMGAPDIRLKALAAGRIDATAVSMATWSMMADRSGVGILLGQDDFFRAAPVVQKVNIVPDAVLQKRRREVLAVTTALMRASRDFARDNALWADAMGKLRPDVSHEDLLRLARSFSADWCVNGGLRRDELEFTAQWLARAPDFAGLRQVPLAEWVDFSVVDEIREKIGDDRGGDPPGR